MLQINSIEFHGSGHRWANMLVDSGCAYFQWVVSCGDFVLGVFEGMESLHIKVLDKLFTTHPIID